MFPDHPHYEVLGKIGEGGFGTVYKARFRGAGDFEKVVAIKVLNEDVEHVKDVAQRLRDEARVLGLIRHRAIVQVDRLVRLNGRWSVVMECVDGIALSWLRREGAVPVGPSLEIVAEVSGALHVAYETPGPDGRSLRLLHRDIKPSNILLTPAADVKILDFGIARAEFETREARTEMTRFGSAGYLAPERHDGLDSPAGDVYALGAVFWGLLMARRFGRTSANADRHEEKLAKGLKDLRMARTPQPVVDLIASMLAFDPDTRPSSRDVERQCHELHRVYREISLRDWAEDVVGGLLDVQTAMTDHSDTGGLILEETGEHLEVSLSSSTLNPASWEAMDWQRAAIGAVATFTVVLVFAALVLVLGQATRPSPARLVAAPVQTESRVVLEEQPAAQPEPAVLVAEPDVRAATISRPRRARPGRGHVKVKGDAATVRLLKGDERLAPGWLAPGAYQIEATFEGMAPMGAGEIEVEAGQRATVNCVSLFTRCSVE